MKLSYILPFSFLILTACGSSGGGDSSSSQSDNSDGGSNLMKQVSAGLNYLCGITVDNIAKCLGENNNSGQQGDGTTHANYSTVQVHNLSQASFVSSNTTNSCFLNGGNVFCSGNNSFGQLGNGNFTNSSVPVQVVGISNIQQVSVGSGSVCALRNDGKIFCWGLSTDSSDPLNQKNSNVPVQLNSNVKFKSISNNSKCFDYCGVSTDGSVYCGLNSSLYLQKVNKISNIISVSSGSGYSCAINNLGTAYCWGANESGELGDGTNERAANPVQVLNVSNFKLIYAFNSTTCGITNDHKTYCWGRGVEGQLGDGSASDSNVPVLVNSNIEFTQITGSLTSTYAIDQNGNTYVWGKRILTNSSEQFDLSPVQVKF